MPWTVLREVILDDSAQKSYDTARSANSRFEDQWLGVEWLLSRTPDKGTPRFRNNPQEYLIYVFPGDQIAETRELWVLYSYDSSQVEVHALFLAL